MWSRLRSARLGTHDALAFRWLSRSISAAEDTTTTPTNAAHDDDVEGVEHYTPGSFFLIPAKHTVGKKIAVRSYLDRNRTELSDRTYVPQRAWFEAYNRGDARFTRDHERKSYDFYNLITKIIWKAFDTPELLGMLLHDEVVKGNTHMYEDEFLDAAIHFVREARYWRCIGISKPFYDNNTLRAHCWEEQGLQTGTLVVSMAMRHALMDLERAVRREELGLSPDYVWDRWGPIGFVDGARNDYLPRFSHNPYVDPDGVDVTELDVLPFNTHEQIRERYGRFIFPSEEDFDGVFGAISHGSLTLDDVPNKAAVELFERMTSMSGDAPPTNNNNNNNTPAVMRRGPISPADLRTVLFLSADPAWLAMAQSKHTWLEVVEALQPTMDAANERIDAARMLSNTRHHPDRIRAYFEEMCGFHDFMRTPDKAITAAVLSYLVELKRVCSETSWGRTLAGAATDVERLAAMGRDAFVVFRHVEDAVLEKKRRLWSARFAGEANEEATLDYLLENFGRRAERPKNVGTTGVEFDREQEPIGRQVQRRTLDTDKANRLAEVRRSRGRMWSKKTSIFDALHEKQVQNTTYGVR